MTISWTLVGLIEVAAKPPGVWQLALEFVGGSRLLRLRVADKDLKGAPLSSAWHQSATNPTTADGIHDGTAKNGLLLTSAPRGALIGKIGGSTADLPDPGNPAMPYGSKKVFAVGSFCVVSLAATDAGPLFMAMNDSIDSRKDHSETLHVLIEEYLL